MRRHKVILILILIFFILMDCKSQVKIDFQSEKGFKNALRGTWILKSYKDSIEKGQTPVMIHAFLAGINGFYYNPDKKYSNIFPEDSSYYVFISEKENFIQHGYSIKFDLMIDSITIIEKDISSYFDTIEKKWKDKLVGPKNIGKLGISTYKNDTIMNLAFFNDNLGVNKIELIKCINYDQLINNNFITGTYCIENDTTKLVCFSSNGNVAGLDIIDKTLIKADQYYVSVGNFIDNRDDLVFQRAGFESIFPIFYWRKSGHDLIISTIKHNSEFDYKLMKIK